MDQDIAIFRKIVRQMSLKILVWGPGRPKRGTSVDKRKGWAKRLQIRRQIRSKFPQANVYFSEDEQLVQATQWIDDQLQREAVQAFNADAVIILAMSRGSEVELDKFIESFAWFRGKAYVLIPDHYINSGGLADTVLNKLPPEHLIGFTQKEFDDCIVAKEKAIHIVDQIATKKFLNTAI